MSLICRQIDQLLKDRISYKEPDLIAGISFDKKFIGFQGHFPDNPVLPGIIILKTMIRMHELQSKNNFRLTQIRQAKFIEPVLSDELITFSVKTDNSADIIKLDGKVFREKKIISKAALFLKTGEKF